MQTRDLPLAILLLATRTRIRAQRPRHARPILTRCSGTVSSAPQAPAQSAAFTAASITRPAPARPHRQAPRRGLLLGGITAQGTATGPVPRLHFIMGSAFIRHKSSPCYRPWPVATSGRSQRRQPRKFASTLHRAPLALKWWRPRHDIVWCARTCSACLQPTARPRRNDPALTIVLTELRRNLPRTLCADLNRSANSVHSWPPE